MSHLGEEATPDSLVQVLVCDAPPDRGKLRPVILDVAENEGIATTARITNNGGCHPGAEPSDSVVLPIKRPLNRVVLGRVQLEAPRNRSTRNFFMRRDACWCVNRHGLNLMIDFWREKGLASPSSNGCHVIGHWGHSAGR